MQQKSKMGPLGTLVIPLMIHFGISFLVSMMASAIIAGSLMPELMNSKIDSTEIAMKLANELLMYTTEITIVTSVLTFPIFIWMFYKDRKLSIKSGVANREKAKLWTYGMIVILSIAICVALNNLLTLSNLAFYSPSYEQTAEALYTSSFALQLIGLGVIVPITEELLFRGVLYNRLLNMMTKKKAMIWCAVVFGFYHGNLVQAVYGGLLGFVLVYIYEKYGSLKAPILAHIILNLTSLVVTEYGGFAWMFAEPMRVGVITVICATVSATVFVFLQRIITEE